MHAYLLTDRQVSADVPKKRGFLKVTSQCEILKFMTLPVPFLSRISRVLIDLNFKISDSETKQPRDEYRRQFRFSVPAAKQNVRVVAVVRGNNDDILLNENENENEFPWGCVAQDVHDFPK